MALAQTITDVTDHLKVYLLAGTLVAIGVDVTTNVTGSMGGMGAAMGDLMAGPMDKLAVAAPLALGFKAVGLIVAAIGAMLYAGNLWCGFVALRRLRFRFEERGVVLQACGWSLAFVYVVSSVVIGVAVNAVYLALVT